MAEFVETMKQVQRLCNNNAKNDCVDCLLKDDKTGHCPIYLENFDETIDWEKVEHKVKKWAAEHPEPRYPTWREWQKQHFPEADRDLYLCNFAECSEKRSCTVNTECLEWVIPAEIAEKLCIKPVEVTRHD